jgi:hypothetical protein
MGAAGTTFVDDFDGNELTEVWVPHYLPMWSSRADSAATYEVGGSELRLTIPPNQGLWCEGVHDDPPLRVSGIQSGICSGAVGSTRGQQPFRDGLVVREHQPTHRGWTPHNGLLEVRARMELSPRSMASAWMVGIEDQRERCGEICIFEVFGDSIQKTDGRSSAAVGMGIHPFRDPKLTEEWNAPRQELDVSEFHTYSAEWRLDRVGFLIDGRHVKTVGQSPDYPMQAMVALFDFPDRASPASEGHVPEFVIDSVRSAPLTS